LSRRGLLARPARLYAGFKDQFLPDFRETDFPDALRRKAGHVDRGDGPHHHPRVKELRAIPGVRNFGAHIGRAEAADEVVWAEFHRAVDQPRRKRATMMQASRASRRPIDGYPGLYRDVLTYLRERIKEVLTGAGATVVVRIFGPDQAELRASRRSVFAQRRGRISRRCGSEGRATGASAANPGTSARRRSRDLRPHRGEVRPTSANARRGQKVGEIYHDQKAFDVALWGEPAVRGDFHALPT
jgi:Cu/Ag efflux pump CusA